MTVLQIAGLAVLILGTYVLLKFHDRPGGTIKMLGLEVSSVGAGLPLVALGILAIALGQDRAGGAEETGYVGMPGNAETAPLPSTRDSLNQPLVEADTRGERHSSNEEVDTTPSDGVVQPNRGPDPSSPVSSVPTTEKAYSFLAEGDYNAAIEAFTSRIEAYPGDVFNYFHRAAAYRRKGNADLALVDLSRVIEISPTHDSALNNRGRLLVDTGDVEEGCTDLERAASLGNETAARSVEMFCQ